MFVRTSKGTRQNSKTVTLVESFRNEQGQPRQRIIRTVGTASNAEDLERLQREGQRLKAELEELQNPLVLPAENLAEAASQAHRNSARRRGRKTFTLAVDTPKERTLILGIHEVFGQLFDELRLGEVFTKQQTVPRRIFRHTTLMRLAEPGTRKSGMVSPTHDTYGWRLSVEKVYRMMDTLTPARLKHLRQRISGHVQRLLPEPLEVAFISMKSLSFTSTRKDDLLQKGWSKDNKPNRVQVVLALVQTREGLPIDYHVFASNTTDIATLRPMLDGLRKDHHIERAVVIMDAGIASHKHLAELDQEGWHYVFESRLRQLPRNVWANALEGLEWSDWHADADRPSDAIRLAEFNHDGRRIVLKYSSRRSANDRRRRERAVVNAESQVRRGSPTLHGEAAKYLQVAKGGVALDEEAIARDASFDGIYGVTTNLDEPMEAVRRLYAGLSQIEDGFSVMKHDLEIRPNFHWTEPRVHAHIGICYTAFALMRILRQQYRNRHPDRDVPSEKKIREELLKADASVFVDIKRERGWMQLQRPSNLQRELYSTVGLSYKAGIIELPKEHLPTVNEPS